jgi:hypothetical protein
LGTIYLNILLIWKVILLLAFDLFIFFFFLIFV